MKVLVVGKSLDKSEQGIFCRLATRGVELSLVRAEPQSGADDPLRALGVPETRYDFKNRFDRHGVKLLQARFRQDKPDIVHCCSNRALSCTLLGTAGRGFKHRIVTYRGTAGHLSYWDPSSWFAYLNPRIDRIWCVSESVRRYLLSKRLPPGRLVTIHKGHDLDWYRHPCGPESLQEFGVPKDAVKVVFVGHMRPVKGVHVLLHALSAVPPELNVHLLLVGEVRDRRLPRITRSLGLESRVHFAGERKDAVGILRHADLHVMPSIDREGLPRAVIEGMAQRVPPLVSDAGGLPELVVDGECGRVVPRRDADSLARALCEMAADPDQRRRYGEQARRRIQTHFNIENTIDQLLEVYRDLTAPGLPVSAERSRA